MTVAMMDAAFLGVVSEVWWATALVAVALAQAVWLRVRSSSNREGSRRGADAMSVHGGIGLIAMAALLVIMCAPAGTTDVGHHAHGSAYATLTLILIGAGYGGASLWLARSGSRLERARILAMGASAVLMTLAAL